MERLVKAYQNADFQLAYLILGNPNEPDFASETF